MLIREATQADAGAFINLRRTLFKETNFLLLEPSEYSPSIQSEAAFIKAFNKSANSTILLVFDEYSTLIGFMGVAGGTTNRAAHKADIFMGILQAYWGRGVGRKLFDHLFIWMKDKNLIRLELTTAINNERALKLYQSIGFKLECIKEKDILIDGELRDEYQMCYLSKK
jgi:RimJ/RimL family protein N-acetyltransferase